MGDYSRNPVQRLQDTVDKHYVAVRLQQGVPLLDADWNIQDDLRRHEHEMLNASVIGDGAPVGSIGFWIVPLPNGGENTIVISANSMGTDGVSSVEIDLAASSAATALGFNSNNYISKRSGSSPAILTGMRSEPFPLSDGDTLSVAINDGTAYSITFASSDFTDISNATATEVTAVVDAVVATANVTAGEGNDFIIKGANSSDTGKILIDGKMVENDQDIKYSEQDLYDNSQLAAVWAVDPVSPLTTPGSSDAYMVYLDVWDREIDSIEDEKLIDVHIGIETTIRLRREWAVRVVLEDDYFSIFNSRPAGHSYYPLSVMQRSAGVDAISGSSMTDMRETEVSFRREVSYRNYNNIVLVSSSDMYDVLSNTREQIRDFIFYLTTKFISPDSDYLAAEVMGIDALSAIAVVAEQGVMLMDVHSVGTKESLSLFERLKEAEKNFVSRWQDSVLPLNKPGEGTIYSTSFTTLINRIDDLVSGPAPGSFQSLSDALSSGDLYECVRTQQRINYEIGGELGRSTGFIEVLYLGSLTSTITRNGNFDMRYRVTGNVTPEDAIDVDVFIDPAWSTELRNLDNSIPLDISMGPGDDEVEFIVSITAPDVAVATTTFSIRAYARSNEVGLVRDSTQKTLSIGGSVPPSEEGFSIMPVSTPLIAVGGVYQFPTGLPGDTAAFNFMFSNNTMTSVDVDITYNTPSAGWTVYPPDSHPDLQNQTILGQNNIARTFNITRPSGNGLSLEFTLTATQHGTANVLGEAVISILTVV